MKKIQLTQGYVALVDDEDYELLNKFTWRVLKTARTEYAIRSDGVKMHRFILNLKASDPCYSRCVDHKNGNGLYNLKENLREVSRKENASNRKLAVNNKTGKTGVRWYAQRKSWRAYGYEKGKLLNLYHGKEYQEAVNAREQWEKKRGSSNHSIT